MRASKLQQNSLILKPQLKRGELTMTNYSVIVSNIGTVYDGNSEREAHKTFAFYKSESKFDAGRASGETVTLMRGEETIKEYRPSLKLPLVKDIRALLIALKPTIGDDYRTDEEDTLPTMCVTIGADRQGNWSYQTGDNSFTGGAYSYPHWAVIYLQRRSDSTALARDAIDQIAERISSEVN